MIFALVLLAPLAAAALAALVKPYRLFVGWLTALLSLAPLVAAVLLCARVLNGEILIWGSGEFLRADSLSTLLVLCIAFVAALTAWLGPGLTAGDGYSAAERRSYRVYSNLFAFTMFLAVTAHNVGVMWVAVEATTITSALLIPLHVTKASVEASWKYILIGSVGIALAFAGTVLAYFDFVNLAGQQPAALNWTTLLASAPSLHREVLQLAFVFLLVGYGTKAGLAPMHTWLPDAHSESPSALSALMSGVLLAVAIYAIIRWKIVVDAAIGPAFSYKLLIALSLLSLAIAAFSLIGQRNYKRMLAYSSIAHAGYILVGVVAANPAGSNGILFYLMAYTAMNVGAFGVLSVLESRDGENLTFDDYAGLGSKQPLLAGLMAVFMFSLSGIPPFAGFFGKYYVFAGAVQAGYTWLAIVGVLMSVVSAYYYLRLVVLMYFKDQASLLEGKGTPLSVAALLVCALALLEFGIFPSTLVNLTTRFF